MIALLLACAASGADILTVPEVQQQALVMVETERTQVADDIKTKMGAILAHLEAMEAELAPDAPPPEPLPAVADSE